MLQESLSLGTGDSLVLFHDEQGVAAANLFAEVARSLRLRYATRFVPHERQAAYASGAGSGISAEDSAALAGADSVLICFVENLKTTAYRRQLIERGATEQRVLGTFTPSLSSLAQAAVRAHGGEQAQRCDDLAMILLRGREAELTTAVLDARGDVIEEHSLTVSLGGHKRCPVTCGGPIAAGTWARLPAPEVSVAPMEDTANGVFVLNGAFPGGVMTGNEHLLLVFASGRLEMVGGNSPRVGEFWNVVEAGKTLGAPPLGLSELGVRLWDASCDTPQQSLLQLCLGDNIGVGGTLRSPVQEILLSRGASLRVDGRPVMREGKFVYDAAAWQESRATAQQLAAQLTGDLVIRRTDNAAHADASGRLRVMRHVGRQRVCSYTLGDADLGGRLCDLYGLLAERREPITLLALSRQCLPGTLAANLAELRGMLGVLEQHRLIEIRQPTAQPS